MTTVPICVECKHWRAGWTCDAFPEGIPLVIQLTEKDHREPIEGDHGIQFEPINAEPIAEPAE